MSGTRDVDAADDPVEPAGEKPGATGGAPRLPTAADIDGFTAWNLVRLGHGVEHLLTTAIGRHGLTTRQFGVLALLHTHRDLTQSDLARAVLVRVQSISPLLGSLVERGLVTRRGPTGRGHRSAYDLTPEGRDLLARSWAEVTALHSPRRLGLGDEEAARLEPLLQTLLDALGQPGRASAPTADDPGKGGGL